VLQMHNHHAALGGAMEVLADEALLLESGGHVVEQLTLPAAEQLQLNPLQAGARAVWNLPITRELNEMITRFTPDVVHVHTPFPLMSPAVFRTASKAGIPTVTTLHSYRYSCIAATCLRAGSICEDCVGKVVKWPGVRHRCYHDSLGASAALTAGLALHRRLGTFDRHVDRFITLTQFAKTLLTRDGIRAEQIVVKPNSVPDPGVPPGGTLPRERFVLFAGRLVKEKGIHTLLQAWRQSDALPELRIAGSGELMADVERAAEQDPRITPLGWLSTGETVDLMRRAGAVVIPSEWYEGLPLVLLRAQSVGAPILISDLENISSELVEDQAGTTFRTGDAHDLADALERLLADPERGSLLGQQARDGYVKRYTPEKNLSRLEAIYASVGAGASRDD
ncbi:MAG: glycosyltransferase family 4 protein, partial [Alteraurantiacibacter sp.]